MADPTDKEPPAETPKEETQTGDQPVLPSTKSFGRISAISLFVLALGLGAGAAAYALPKIGFHGFAKFVPRFVTSVAIVDPAINAKLKDLQTLQQQSVAALRETGGILQQNAATLREDGATLESVRQRLAAQQTSLKGISNQLSSLTTRVDGLQNAVGPLTTSSIGVPRGRAKMRGASQKKLARLPKPFGPVSVGGAPLSPAPAPGPG